MSTSALLISGAAGVGKSSTAFEISLRLQRAGIPHALIDSDELDRIFPVPDDLARLSERNLAAVWQGFHERGVRRLLLAGVYVDQPSELAWIRRAVPHAELLLVRLVAPDHTVLERVAGRELGSGLEMRVDHTTTQLRNLQADRRPEVHRVRADASVGEVATEVLRLTGWLESSDR